MLRFNNSAFMTEKLRKEIMRRLIWIEIMKIVNTKLK